MPGTRNSEPVIGSLTPWKCASVTGTRSGSAGTSGLMANSLTSPAAERHADFFGLLVGGDAGGEGRRHRIAADDVAARGAAALAAGEHPQQARGRAARRGGELVLGDVDDPGALADRHAGERDRVAGVQPALRQRRIGRRHDARPSPQRRPQTEATVQSTILHSPRSAGDPLCPAGSSRSRHCRGRMAAYPRSRSGMRRFYDRERGLSLAVDGFLDASAPRHYTSAVHCNRHFRRRPSRTGAASIQG